MLQIVNLENSAVSGCTSHHQLMDSCFNKQDKVLSKCSKPHPQNLVVVTASREELCLCRGTGSIACVLEKDADSVVPKNVCTV